VKAARYDSLLVLVLLLAALVLSSLSAVADVSNFGALGPWKQPTCVSFFPLLFVLGCWLSCTCRQLNEALYTQPGDASFSTMQQQPQLFEQYHEGFQQQVGCVNRFCFEFKCWSLVFVWPHGWGAGVDTAQVDALVRVMQAKEV
jgi:hypothetical protein